MPYGSSVSRSDLLSGLVSLGLRGGDNIVVHSRLSSFGHLTGGANTVIDVLQEIVTDKGTIVMPTFSGELIFFLECLALDRGINGEGSTGIGTVFEGTGAGFWEAIDEVSRKNGIRCPFDGPLALGNRIRGERMRILKVGGWKISWDGEELSDSSPVSVSRDSTPLAGEEVRPWMMPAWTGLIPDTFWRRPDVQRSHQYSGSFAAWGRLASDILEGHDNRPGQKMEDHPLYRMKEVGGRILLLGVDHGVNSTIHVAQWTAHRDGPPGVPASWREFLSDFHAVEGPLESRGGQRKAFIGPSQARLAETDQLFDVVADLLREKFGEEVKRCTSS
ncbi:MAG: AAC(3) family N-acetyltransferase [Theionarchaea archaeon]|nr:AAC(3) family N-acetyltransferase [Theionarchaea archaeon]